ncbi:MAG: dihydropyrimidine dehydrogenase [Firmicutes bacterium]|nr:dihydropyrimidine dehydrogenase [Bacillota bacterium]
MNNIEDIKKKANYCESCITKPCQTGCPLYNDITDFIKMIKEEKYEEGYKILSKTTFLESVCGRICPHQKQCQGMCVKGVSYEPVNIGDLETFIGDLSIKNNWTIDVPDETKYKVAVIGSGPSSLTCAAFLRKNGIGVTIYEKYDYLGGLLVHGIPDFRLPKDIVKDTVDKIINLGIDVKYNCKFGEDITLEQLQKEHDAVFIGIGANVSNKMNVLGEELKNVYGANEILEYKLDINFVNKIVVICGGGDVAMDIARFVKRKNAKKVIITYRRSEDEMPADKKEIEEAKNEGIEFLLQTNILKITGDKKVSGINLIKTKLVKKEGELRLSPVNIEGSEYNLECDYVISAIGASTDKNLLDKLNLKLNSKNQIMIDTKGHTSIEKVYAGGDVTGAKSTVSWAARSGRNAALEIINKLKGEE